MGSIKPKAFKGDNKVVKAQANLYVENNLSSNYLSPMNNLINQNECESDLKYRKIVIKSHIN